MVAVESVADSALPMMQVVDIIYEYPGLRAVDRVTLEIEQGSITALIGPNGAGKTTLMHCMAGLSRPMQGHIFLKGRDVYESQRWAQSRMGYLPDFFGLYEDLTVAQSLQHRAAAQGMKGLAAREAVMRAAERMSLHRRMDQRAGALSRGLRQRLAIAQAIIHEPPFLMLDEPASGLDPEARYALSQVLRDLRASGMTLLVSSHILSELEDYSTHLAIMRDGQILDYGAMQAMRIGQGDVVIHVDLPESATLAETQIKTALQDFAEVQLLPIEKGASFQLVAPNEAALHAQILAALVQAGVTPASFSAARASLQESYMARLKTITAGRGRARAES